MIGLEDLSDVIGPGKAFLAFAHKGVESGRGQNRLRAVKRAE